MIDDDIKNLIHIFRFTVYNPGEVIIDEGEMSTDIFFILSGECSAHVNKNSVGTLKKNQIFGEFAFLLQQPRSATIRAISQTVIIKFRFDEELFRKYPFSFSMLYKNITEELILKIINMNNIKSSV
jgi:CRP-like cAMP-binding protein